MSLNQSQVGRGKVLESEMMLVKAQEAPIAMKLLGNLIKALSTGSWSGTETSPFTNFMN